MDDVHQALLEQIGATAFPVGARLPSCRALAQQLGSNPSTVDRAIQRLAEAGLVRTIPRRGTFVSATEAPREDVLASLSHDIDRIVARATAAGLDPADIRERFEHAIERANGQPSVAFVECNKADLEHMADMVENATGITVERILLDDVVGTRLDTRYDIIAAPLFHLADVAEYVSGLDVVVEINFVAAPTVLRRLAMLGPDQRVVVAAPTRRGLERMTALVRQYYPDDVEPFLIGTDDPARLAGADALVRSNAGALPIGAALGADDPRPEEIVVEWELDPGFVASFRSRVGEVLGRRVRADLATA
ncbi:MAG: GntR family transcriptional regulator [Actinomycetota bacterium]|nr:GntR family transcriptional regulator [Actinomycetota bacterium]